MLPLIHFLFCLTSSIKIFRQSSLCSFLIQVTYRVVQVTEDHLEAAGDGEAAVSVVSTAAFAGAQQAVAQVWIRLEGNMEKKKQCIQKVI